jgi:hypothetical protein
VNAGAQRFPAIVTAFDSVTLPVRFRGRLVTVATGHRCEGLFDACPGPQACEYAAKRAGRRRTSLHRLNNPSQTRSFEPAFPPREAVQQKIVDALRYGACS